MTGRPIGGGAVEVSEAKPSGAAPNGAWAIAKYAGRVWVTRVSCWGACKHNQQQHPYDPRN
ncbi:MAG: hypothetical protein HOI66_06105 [Verrucomicrobia bacterium]|nr:hypothetical protein [Verrucomicrobiota bacterium]